jgi:hypothetical protein
MVVNTIIPTLRRLRQEDNEFLASMGCTVTACLEQTKTK